MNQDTDSLAWRTSSASSGGNCVEVAISQNSVLVRNTRNRAGSVLEFTESEWAAFVLGVGSGEFALDVLRES